MITVNRFVATIRKAAGVVPTVTRLTVARFAPVIVTLVPPVVQPVAGVSVVTAGAPTYVSVRCDVPHALDTATATRPAWCAGTLTTKRVEVRWTKE